MSERKIARWITVRGKHIPIYEGESVAKSLSNHFKLQRSSQMNKTIDKENEKYRNKRTTLDDEYAEKRSAIRKKYDEFSFGHLQEAEKNQNLSSYRVKVAVAELDRDKAIYDKAHKIYPTIKGRKDDNKVSALKTKKTTVGGNEGWEVFGKDGKKVGVVGKFNYGESGEGYTAYKIAKDNKVQAVGNYDYWSEAVNHFNDDKSPSKFKLKADKHNPKYKLKKFKGHDVKETKVIGVDKAYSVSKGNKGEYVIEKSSDKQLGTWYNAYDIRKEEVSIAEKSTLIGTLNSLPLNKKIAKKVLKRKKK